jgi:hypothetical protein
VLDLAGVAGREESQHAIWQRYTISRENANDNFGPGAVGAKRAAGGGAGASAGGVLETNEWRQVMITSKILGTVAVLSFAVFVWSICVAAAADEDKAQTPIAIGAFHLVLFFISSLFFALARIWGI